MYRYLPELEDRILPVFNKVLNEQFFHLSLDDEEQHDLKQILKFLLSNEVLDEGTKRFDINKVRKFLASPDEKVRWQGWLIVQVLEQLGEKELSDDILNNMAISIGVIKLTYDKQTNIGSNNRIEELRNILNKLKEIEKGAYDVKASLKQYFKDSACLKISKNGKAVQYLKELSSSQLLSDDISVLSDNNLYFIYFGNLEDKLRRVYEDTWRSLSNDTTIQDLLCFYSPDIPKKNFYYSQEPEKYVCRTFREVLEIVQKKRSSNNYKKF